MTHIVMYRLQRVIICRQCVCHSPVSCEHSLSVRHLTLITEAGALLFVVVVLACNSRLRSAIRRHHHPTFAGSVAEHLQAGTEDASILIRPATLSRFETLPLLINLLTYLLTYRGRF